MDTAHGWVALTMPATGTTYYYHTGRQEYQPDPPYYEILGLDPKQCDTYGKSDIQAAWYKRSKMDVSEVDGKLIREAYEVLRFTNTRMSYNYRNILSSERVQNNAALYALRIMRVAN
jgi:curved DNA-binding protein CbpA